MLFIERDQTRGEAVRGVRHEDKRALYLTFEFPKVAV
jgi:hypothetical protein